MNLSLCCILVLPPMQFQRTHPFIKPQHLATLYRLAEALNSKLLSGYLALGIYSLWDFASIKHEPDLVVSYACRKTTITLRPYHPLAPSLDKFNAGSFELWHVTVGNVQINLH